jgi:diaminohydroxyphosphoribosylaminopyrimidine deaminase/5-amino-6-(5-phosphoribosylamino)uracil reductase
VDEDESALDRELMARALHMAIRGLYTTDPNPRVGCVIAHRDSIVGEGSHLRAGEPHAEIHALAAAGDRARDASVYVTLEPCCHEGRTGPCTSALIRAGVRRVVAAMQDPNPLVAGRGIEALRAAGISVEVGLLGEEAIRLNPGFVKRFTRNLPYVRCKLGMSLDGRTAMASGESRWITGPEARQDVQRLRARSSAILTGINTVLADDPSLTVRDADLGEAVERQPLRIVADSGLRTPPAARTLGLPGKVLIVGTAAGAARRDPLIAAGAEVQLMEGADGRVDLAALMGTLAARGLNEVLVESGPELAGQMVQKHLVDEIILYVAPMFLGDRARGLLTLPDLLRLSDRVEVDILDIRRLGGDLRITAVPRPGGVAIA